MPKKSRNQRRKEAERLRRMGIGPARAVSAPVEEKEIASNYGAGLESFQADQPERQRDTAVLEQSQSTSPAPPSNLDFSATATGQQIFNNEVMGALGRMAAAVEGLANQVQLGFADVNSRIATVEQAQAEGLLTLSTQSGLSVAGLSGQDTGPSQGQLSQTREFSELRRAEMAILSEESNDLPPVTDERMVIVGATTEAEVERRRRMLEEIMSRGGNY